MFFVPYRYLLYNYLIEKLLSVSLNVFSNYWNHPCGQKINFLVKKREHKITFKLKV